MNNWIQIYNLIMSDPSICIGLPTSSAFQKFHRDSRLHMAFDLTEAIGVLLSGDVNHQDVGRVFDVAAPFTAKPAKKKNQRPMAGGLVRWKKTLPGSVIVIMAVISRL